MIYFTTTTASTQNTLIHTLTPKNIICDYLAKGIKKSLWKCRQKTTMKGLRSSSVDRTALLSFQSLFFSLVVREAYTDWSQKILMTGI
jgi:hypothetical protein